MGKKFYSNRRELKTLLVRSITGLIFGITLIGLIVYSFDTFLILTTFILFGSFFELKKLFEKAEFKINKNVLILKSIIVFLLSVYPVFIGNESDIVFFKIRILIFILLFLITIIELLFTQYIIKPIAEFIFILYLFIWYQSALNIFYFQYNMQYHYEFVLSIVFMIWANDTFAYFTGMLFGKHKLMPAISPKKTIEGFAGGLLFTLITAYLCYEFLLNGLTILNLYDCFAIGLIVNISGTLGDLIESKIKRLAEVKDSGNILPGHGGILDRLDAWYLVIPSVEVYFILKQVLI